MNFKLTSYIEQSNQYFGKDEFFKLKCHLDEFYNNYHIMEQLPARAAFSIPCLATGGTFSGLTAGLGGRGGTAALCIPCESHRINGVRAPV